MQQQELKSKIYEAFVFGVPFYEVARTRHNDLSGMQGAGPLRPNTLRHGRALSGPEDRWVTAPNNDTLYSRAWLDLSRGPVVVRMDVQPRSRYWSLSFLDASTRIFALVGQRTNGEGPVQLTLVGPQGDASCADGQVLRAPSNDVWLFARWLVEGEQDLPEARAMQDRISICAAAGATPCVATPTRSLDPENFLAVVAEQLRRNPPSRADAQWTERLSSIGIQPGATSPWHDFPDAVRDAWMTEIGSCHQRLHKIFIDGRRQVDGWWVAQDRPGDGAAAYEWRAGVALVALAGLESNEALYAARMSDDLGEPLHGRYRYRLTVPPSGIPVGAFWSISLYELMPDGCRFFASNPLRRYSVGDRTPGLLNEPDGALVIALQPDMPSDARARANWLPVPTAFFSLTLRAYHPSDALRQCAVPLPKLERVG